MYVFKLDHLSAPLSLPHPQAVGDAVRLQELQESVLSLSAQVQQLQPLAPQVMMLEAEKASLAARLERTEETMMVGWGGLSACVPACLPNSLKQLTRIACGLQSMQVTQHPAARAS